MKHPSLSDAVATIHYVVNLVSHKVVWEFAVGDGDNRLASEMFPDDC